MPGKNWFVYALIAPLLIPPYVHGIAWSYFSPFLKAYIGFDLYTIWGVIWVLTLAWFPLVTLTTMAGLQSIDRNMEEASLLVHGPFRTTSKITLPLCLPHVICGSIFVFIFAITNTEVPDILRVRVYPLEIFIQFSAFFDIGKATTLSLPIMVLTLWFIVFQRVYMGDRLYLSGLSEKKDNLILFSMKWINLLFLFISIIIAAGAVIVPLFILLIKSGGPLNYFQAFTSSIGPFGFSLVPCSGSSNIINYHGKWFRVSYAEG